MERKDYKDFLLRSIDSEVARVQRYRAIDPAAVVGLKTRVRRAGDGEYSQDSVEREVATLPTARAERWAR